MNNSLDAGDIGAVVQARDVHADTIHLHARGEGGRGRVVPAELPPPPGTWADRDDELAALAVIAALAALRSESPAGEVSRLVVITGPGGVGKTSLALRWLHSVRADYGDGQLYVDLRGFSGGEPAQPGEVLEQFLRALGVAPERVPLEAHERAKLFRTLTTERRLIVLLDNARSAEQVKSLLPGAGDCLVVVTARRRMTGLAGHAPVFFELGPLEESGAVELLAAILGPERTDAEPQATRALAMRCGGLPLAVCLSGAYLIGHRRHSIEYFTARLAQEAGRLLELRMEDDEMNDTSVHAAYTTSYQSLPLEAQRLYRLVSVYPADEFDSYVAAAAAGITFEEADRLLDILVDRHLLDEPGGLRFHDLGREHARGLAEQIDGPQEYRKALERIAEWMLRTEVNAALQLNPDRWWLGRYFQPEYRPEPVDYISNRVQALQWLEDHYRALFAVAKQTHATGMHYLTCEIVEAAWPLFTHRKLYTVWVDAHQLGVDAAEADGDERMQARMLLGVGAAYKNLHDFDRAVSYARQALDLARQAGHRESEGTALEILGVAAMATGRPDEAVELFERSRTIWWQLDRPRGAALMTRHLGEAHAKAGRYGEAAEHFTVALQFFTAGAEPYLRARALSGLAATHLATGRFDEAERALRESLSLCRNISSYHEEANVLVMLARLAQHHGDTTTWRTNLESALSIYTDLDAPEIEQITQMLDDCE